MSIATAEPLSRGHKKRARTRTQILDAATRMYSRGEIGDVSIVGLAEEAQVANGTVYNHFRTREEVLEATALELAERFSEKIAAAYAKLTNGAQRMAIGQRWFVKHAQEDPTWGAAIVRIFGTAKAVKSLVADYVRKDLRLGKKQGEFSYSDENVAVDLCLAVVLSAVRTSLEGSKITDHPEKSAEMVLLALGVNPKAAKEYAHMPLPSLTDSAVVSGTKKPKKAVSRKQP